MKFFVALLALCFCLSAPPMAGAQDGLATPTENPANQSATASGLTDDTRISERIRDLLIELDGYENVEVSVRSGIVTLSGEVLDDAELARLEDLVTAIDGVVAIENEVAETTDLVERLNPAIARMQDRVRQTIAVLPLVAVAVAAALVVWLLGLRIARLHQPWERLAPNAFIANIYRQVVGLVFIVLGIVIALDILNATALLGTILGAAGIIGLAIGFAVRDTVENFIASIMLSIRQPFQPNDAVEINGDQGKVIRLTSRATILLSFDGNHIRIPNATVFKSRIVNFSRNPERRFMFTIGVEADSDLAAVRQLIETTVANMPFTLETPGTSVWIEDMTESGVIFTVTGWVDQTSTSLLRARGETLRLVKLAIEQAGYAIPDTTYRLRIVPPLALPQRDPGPATSQTRPSPIKETEAVIGVEVIDDEIIDDMIKAERNDKANPDLLRRNAPTE